MRPNSSAHVRAALTLYAAAILAVAVSSCGEAPVVPAQEKVATTAAGYGRAFGRIIFVEDGKEKTWGSGVLAFEVLDIYVRSTSTGQM